MVHKGLDRAAGRQVLQKLADHCNMEMCSFAQGIWMQMVVSIGGIAVYLLLAEAGAHES